MTYYPDSTITDPSTILTDFDQGDEGNAVSTAPEKPTFDSYTAKPKPKPVKPEEPRYTPEKAAMAEDAFTEYCRKWERYFLHNDEPIVGYEDYWKLPPEFHQAADYDNYERMMAKVRLEHEERQRRVNDDGSFQKVVILYRDRKIPLTRKGWDEHCEEKRIKIGPFWQVSKKVGKEGSEVADLGRFENTAAILKFLRIDCYTSDMTHEPVFVRSGRKMDLDPVMAEVRECARKYAAPGIDKQTLREHISLIAGRQHKHEFMEWLKTACPDGQIDKWEWDHVDRGEQLLDSITLADGADRDLARRMLSFWSLQVAMALTQERGQYRGVLTLSGPENEGKSRWIAALGPADCVLSGQPFDPQDKDHVRQFCSRTISEMSEVDATFRKRDLSILKAFLGRDEDVFRVPYAEGVSHWGRRTVAVATVNPDSEGTFLADKGTRWWILPVRKCNPAHGIDMRHYWIQRIHALKAIRDFGGQPYPDHDLMDEFIGNSEKFRVRNPIEQAVKDMFVMDLAGRMSSEDIAHKVKDKLGLTAWSRADAGDMWKALRRLGADTVMAHGSRRWTVSPAGGLALVVDNDPAAALTILTP